MTGVTELAARLRAERIAAGLSQTALAGDDFSPSYISLIESGRRVPTDAALRVLAERLGTTADYLREGDKAPTEEAARLEIGFARLALANGEAEQARDRLLALDLSTIAPRHHFEVLSALARAHEALGELEHSVGILEPLLVKARKEKQYLEAARVATDLVASYLEAGDLNHSAAIGEEVIAEVEAHGLGGTDEHLRLASTVLWTYQQRGDLLFATHRAAELIRLADAAGTNRGRGSIYWNAALVAEARGNLAEARRLTERALAYLSEGGSTRDVPRLRQMYAWLLLRSDPPEPVTALEQLSLAQPALVESGSDIEVARCEMDSARAYLMLGDERSAEENARAALGRLEGSPRLDACDAHITLGDVLAARGDFDEAMGEYKWAADMLGMMSASRQSASVWRALGDRLLQHGDLEGAIRAYDAALREAGIRPTNLPVVTSMVSTAAGFSTED